VSNLVVPTQRQIHNFIIEFGVKEDEPLDIVLEDNPDATINDPELMIGLGYFWSNKHKVYIKRDSVLYEEKENEIVEYLKSMVD